MTSQRGTFPHSSEEAKNHVKKIRDKRLAAIRVNADDSSDEDDYNRGDLEEALQTLSDDLYASATHFLVELLQNADDAHYDVPNPTVSITKYPGYLQLDCNEIGFSRENLKSICRVGKSTKKGKKMSNCVGEKGIGFKSVFKAASEVWINSGYYTFKFDRKTNLGMVTPEWSAFPPGAKRGYTSILMKMTNTNSDVEVYNEINTLDPRVLMFLRKIRHIDISVTAAREQSSKQTRSISRHDKDNVRELVTTGRTRRYFLHRHLATDLPSDSKRLNISESEVTLAFPFECIGREVWPVSGIEPLFAFLPVRTYGFRFLVQADFLLASNREDINDSHWNSSLLEAATTAFVDAIHQLAKEGVGSMKYAWIRYLPVDNAHIDGPIEDFRKGILERLKGEKILVSQTGSMEVPSSMFFVPTLFRGKDTIPVTATSSNSRTYLSPHYKESDLRFLEALGVERMSESHFIADLRLALTEKTRCSSSPKMPIRLLGSDDAWHSSVAEILVRLEKTMVVDCKLPIIPLRDGSWVSSDTQVFFAEKRSHRLSKHSIPDGIKIPVVSAAATKDENRRQLFSILGVKHFENDDITRVIVDTHLAEDFRPNNLTPEVLAAQLIFLFKAQWKNKDSCDLWVLTRRGRCLRASETYQKSGVLGSAWKLLNRDSNTSYGFLHPIYKVGLDTSDTWCSWLKSEVGIFIHPRLLAEQSVGLGIPPVEMTELRELIHPDFLSIMEKPASTDFLSALRYGWSFYSQHFSNDLSIGDSQQENKSSSASVTHGIGHFRQTSKLSRMTELSGPNLLTKYFREHLVPCEKNLGLETLQSTILPREELQRECPWSTSFIKLPNANDPEWDFLETFDVCITNNLHFYLQCLRQAKKVGLSDGNRIEAIMEQIQARIGDDTEGLVKALKEEDLIYRPSGLATLRADAAWLSLNSCVWDGPPWLKTTASLRRIFPTCETLFTTKMNVANLELSHIIKELQNIRMSNDIDYITSLFTLLNKEFERGAATVRAREQILLEETEYFPIIGRRPRPNDREYNRLESIRSEDWYIADNAVLDRSFSGKVAVLAFNQKEVLSLLPLFERLGLSKRFLSKAATMTVLGDEHKEDEPKLTHFYRYRGKYISRLIPREEATRRDSMAKLGEITVYSCQDLSAEWAIQVRGRTVRTGPVPNNVILREVDGKLEILQRKDYIQSHPPLDLVNQLARHLSIPTHYHVLLTIVLMDVDDAILDVQFEEQGVPDDRDSWDYVFDDIYTSNEVPRTKNKTMSAKVILTKMGDFVPYGDDSDGVRALTRCWVIATGAGGDEDMGEERGNGVMGDYVLENGPRLAGVAMILLGGLDHSKPSRKERLLGESKVSKMLQAILGKAYLPDRHWTSQCRKDAGHSQYGEDDSLRATFTFEDIEGRFAHFLLSRRYTEAAEWTKKKINFHVEVKSTKGDHLMPFRIEDHELARAREHSLNPRARARPKNVCIWVRVSNVKDEERCAWILDPWERWVSGAIQIVNENGYTGRCLV